MGTSSFRGKRGFGVGSGTGGGKEDKNEDTKIDKNY